MIDRDLLVGNATIWQKIRAVISWVDLLLWDIKHLAMQAHERATGVGNRLILENLKRASGFVRIWLRVPLIGGYNDGEDYFGKVIALAQEVGAEKISLLPYHEGGKSKNEQIGRTYPFPGAQAPTVEQIARLRQLIVANGIDAGIGN